MVLSGPRLVRLATRLPAYQGVVAARLEMLKPQPKTVPNVDLDLTEPPAPPPQVPQGRFNPESPGGDHPAGGVAKRNPDAPDLLLPGPQIPGAKVIPAVPAVLAISEMGHLFSFGQG